MTPSNQTPKFSFLTTFVFPALLIFLVPVLSFFFFWHAQSRFDSRLRESILSQIRADPQLSAEQRDQMIAFFTEVPVSRLMANEQFAAMFPGETRFYYATFRWMIWLSAASVLLSVAVFLGTGLCVVLSLTSPFVQYLSLYAGWHLLRIYGALQTLVQGILLVALSFWVTALWTNSYYPKLILVVGLLALAAVGLVIAAIFRRIKEDFAVEGQVIEKDEATPIWSELRRICDRVGTDLPDQLIAGIDDNFFVTEQPVLVGDRTYHGRTLFVSLSLLKQLQGGEADAVLAHEMAHFSGQDTLYSRKISPLLSRYSHYLQALHQGGVTLPIYYFMLCFRALYQLSLGKLSRQREFRADRISMETTSVRDVAGALLRTIAYSSYRDSVQRDLFSQEQALQTANVSERIGQGFHQYATSFTSSPDIGNLAPAHPFDSHPPLVQRLQAIGMQLESEEAQRLLAAPGDGRWYQYIPAAEQMEKEQWQQFEERFREYHEQSLPYRFLPETDEELAIVVKWFPPVNFEGKQGTLALDHDKMAFDQWPAPIRYAELTNLTLKDNGVLQISYNREGKQKESLPTSKFARQQEVLDAIQHYYGRYLSAVAYQKEKKQEAASIDQDRT
jgi:Zn-dependent protease with chaperone function